MPPPARAGRDRRLGGVGEHRREPGCAGGSQPTAGALAMLRVLAELGPAQVGPSVSEAADRLVATGLADPPWVASLGAPEVGRCFGYADGIAGGLCRDLGLREPVGCPRLARGPAARRHARVARPRDRGPAGPVVLRSRRGDRAAVAAGRGARAVGLPVSVRGRTSPAQGNERSRGPRWPAGPRGSRRGRPAKRRVPGSPAAVGRPLTTSTSTPTSRRSLRACGLGSPPEGTRRSAGRPVSARDRP